MTDTQQLLNALGKPFPESAIKEREGGGRSKFRYVAGHTVIHRLNDATGGQWSWHVKSFDIRPAGTDRYGKDVSLVVVTGELNIPGLGTRAGIGVQKVTENGGEDLVKGASTDALKKAATLFGVALELYGEDFEDDGNAAAKPAPRQQPTLREREDADARVHIRLPPAPPSASKPSVPDVLAILGEMDDAREPWHDIKRYADDQAAGRDGDDVLRIHDKLKAIAARRKTVKAPAGVNG